MTSDVPEEAFEALKAREPIFHRPEFGTARADFEAMIDVDFWEVGASGRVYKTKFVLDSLETRHSAGPIAENWAVSDCVCRDLGGNVFLFTYQLSQDQRVTRRATLWRHDKHGWKALYHQGTLVSS